MGIPRFFKLPEHKRFTYRPLFYDPQKERREERNREIARELGINQDKVKFVSKISHGSFSTHYIKRYKVKNSSNLRLLVIIIILFGLAYLILFR